MGTKILIVEDSPLYRRSLQEELEDRGYTVVAALDPNELTIETLRPLDFDIALVDAMTYVATVSKSFLTGPNITDRLREIHPGIVVIAMSSDRGYLKYGDAGWVKNEESSSRLCELIEGLLSEKR